MSYVCYHCKKIIADPTVEDYVYLGVHQHNNSTRGNLYFHVQCFRHIAGHEILKDAALVASGFQVMLGGRRSGKTQVYMDKFYKKLKEIANESNIKIETERQKTTIDEVQKWLSKSRKK